MKARVEIEKSYDGSKSFKKDWKNGDFEQFFLEEGQYLDRLANITEEHGADGEGFTVTYTVTLTK